VKKAFFEQIENFNAMYRLESHSKPTLLPLKRLNQFYEILKEEVEEGLELAEKYQALQGSEKELIEAQIPSDSQASVEILTEMADWLGDIIVYCASEAKRWGLPLEKILEVIMESNFSKLDDKGQPIYDHRGKVMKGPGYWRPEERIQQLIQNLGVSDRPAEC
jgi:predicted HAD superfamily Cof-like phosphohydrolase